MGEHRTHTRHTLAFGGVALLGACSLGALVTLYWSGADDAPDKARHIEQAQMRPDQVHFRPLNGVVLPAAGASITYVPVYSTLYMGDRQIQAGLAVTLSLRNTSPDQDLIVHRADFYDTAGKLTRRLTDRPHAVPSLATAEFFIDRDDPVGGTGANYLVEWSIASSGTPPLIEAVMVGRLGSAGITLVSRGSVVRALDGASSRAVDVARPP